MSELPVNTQTLQNGMRLLSVPMEHLKSVTVLVMVGVGSRFEDEKVAGVSHFLEHMPFKGTEKYPTALDIAEAIDGVGGKHNAFTGKEYTGYWVKLASEQWELAVDVVSDMLLTPKLREEDIEREKGVIVEEINMREDEPQVKVSEEFDQLVYGDSPLSREVIGYKETVMKLSRDDFMAHYDKWYAPENVVIGVVGSVPQGFGSGFVSRVEKAFSKGEARSGGGERVYGEFGQKKPRMKIYHKETEQAHFHLGFPGVSRSDPDRYAMSVMTTALGGNSSSRLFNEIREKRGLAYYAYASADVYHDMGSVYALEGVNTDKVEEAISVTLSEFERVLDDGFSEKEVERAKEYVIGKMTLDLEDSARVANLMVRKMLLEGEVETVEEILDKVRAVSVEDVARVAERIMDFEKLNLAVVGPYEDKGRFGELIGV